MASSTGYVIAAGALALANDAIFIPGGLDPSKVNWRIIPATAIMALMLDGLGQLAPEFATGLGALVLISVLVVPIGHAPTPLENLAKYAGGK
jgi:hypothetical protein